MEEEMVGEVEGEKSPLKGMFYKNKWMGNF